jgi:hypothetical protein
MFTLYTEEMVQTSPQTKTRQLVRLKAVPQHRPWLTERRLRRLVAERRVPYHKIGGSVFLDLADLDALAEAGRTEPAVF